MNNNLLGYLLTSLSAVAFATSSLLTKYAYQAGMSAWSFTLVYSLLALLLLLPLVIRERVKQRATGRKISRSEWWWLVPFILGGAAAAVTFNVALVHLSVSLGTLLLFTYPAWVAVESWLILGQRPTLRHGVAIALTLAGALLTANPAELSVRGVSTLGVGLALASAVAHALNLVTGERLAAALPSLSATGLTRLSILVGAVVLHPGVLGEITSVTPAAWAICLLTAMVAGVAPFFFLYRGIALIGANRAAIVSVVELPVVLLLGLLLQGDQILPLQWIGGALIALAVLISQWTTTKVGGS